MKLVVLDPVDLKQLIRERRMTGEDRFDEVWNGVYVMSPLADNEHQDLATALAAAIIPAIGAPERGRVLAGTNLTDRPDRWMKNFRCPDVAVFLPGNPAEDRGTHWFGGPDFAIEILSRHDRSRRKFTFYKTVGVRELLLVDRQPWCLELYRMSDGEWMLVGKSSLEEPAVLASAVLPLMFRLVPGDPRPRIEVTRTEDQATRWLA